MAISDIAEFSAALGTGIHGNRYKVLLTLPDGVKGDSRIFSLMVRSTTVPAMETGIIEVPYKGKVSKQAGDERPAGEWSVTAYLENSETALTAKTIAEQWQKLSTDSKKASVYKTDGTIEIVSPDTKETSLGKWKIEGVWIANSGEIELSDATVDEIVEFSLSLQYDKVERV